MLGISQLQFPSRDSGKLRFFSYLGTFVSLSILLNPVNICFMGATLLFRSEIKTFYVYQEMKAAKQQKVNKREYWEIFFKNNIIKVVYFFLLSAGMMYLSFTSTFLLVASLGAVPLTMLLILLQSELRPKDFNPLTLFKAAMKFFVEGIKENSRALVNSFDAKFEHLIPHMLNDETIKNIKLLAEKYGEKIPECKDVINSGEFTNFIEYIEDSRVLKDEAKNKLILFLKDFCENDQQHSSGFTGGQVLLLVLRACSDGEGEAIINKRDALIVNLLDTQTFSTKERIPNTCFTGIVYRMLSSLEGMHHDPEIKFTPPRRMFLAEAKNQASRILLGILKKKKNSEEIFNAWYKVQNDLHDSNSQKIVDDFIAEVRMPLMRELLGFGSIYTEQIVLMLMNSINSIELRPRDVFLPFVEHELQKHDLNDNQKEDIKWKIFLELLNEKFLNTDFLLKKSTPGKEKELMGVICRMISEIIKKEVEWLKLEPKKSPLEGQVVGMLNHMNMLPRSRRCYRIYKELGKNAEDKREVKRILHEKLELPEETINALLKEEYLNQLKFEIKDSYNYNKNNVAELYCKLKGIKEEFAKNGLLTAEEMDSIVKGEMADLSKKDKFMSSNRLSRVNKTASGYSL
ncbi:hypothetical protein IC220_00805 [Wolbachia endosymbiont of Pentalonia nigronervosa]|uniref:hypothetical protein n=1 Tax=Wolbachia endosymbiont of Pentalonia nigronervosa TaxID=1301914 RepID=UPI00165ED434|nr:hypothetical protein [Wolbachia endosymbiont of Pentalonia nigronervosa]MBD0391007.1 hypothetical protein [Wolbachia endosymbiont of Pentalonia nigronervosa]